MFTCNFVFESRDSNSEAHSIAKFACSLGQGRHLWLGQPHDLRCISLSLAYELIKLGSPKKTMCINYQYADLTALNIARCT